MSEDDANTDEDKYIKTAAHNYVSRKASVYNTRNVVMKGKSVILAGVDVRGDFGQILIGRYCQIGTGSILRPSFTKTSATKNTSSSSSSPLKFLPLTIGNHTRIGSNCLVQCASIGSSVTIGNNVVLSNRCIIKDNVYVGDDTVIAEDMVIPPFSVVKGCPGKVVGELMESCAVEIVDESEKSYMEFVKGFDDDGRRKA